MPTAAAVSAAWLNPPSEYGPEPYYGLNGPVTIDVVRRDLDTMHALGYRAVTVQYGYGSGMDYMSQEYLNFFRQFVLEAKKRDMRVWIVDDAGYPSGFAGGKFTSLHPELRMQALIVADKTSVPAHGRLDKSVGPDTVAITAIRSSDGELIQIPFTSGRVQWTAPDGDWTVYIVEHAFRTSPTRSDTNPKRTKDATQSLEDYLNPAATAQYLAFTHEAYKKAVGDEFGKTILGFRGDEPDYSISGLPWTPQFFDRFKAEKAYDIRPFLASFLQPRDVQLTPEQLRARADYYDVFADMFRDGFFKPQGEWCAANNLEYQVHLNHEEQQLQLARSEGDFFRDMKYVQVPGIDSIWHQIWFDTVSDFPRFASSAAHVYGHPRAFTESFAAYRPMPDIKAARYIINEQIVRGINLVETMYFPATSTPGRGGPMPFMRDPGYPALMNYTRRLSYVMSQGRPAADVALLLPAESLWMGDKAADDTFVTTERLLSEHQVDFDIVGEDALASDLTLKAGAFVTKSGNEYHAVLVPRAELLPIRLIDRL
ncbi:MAG TPA: glycosyl hydrolase, partial [Acidobacteriaceae bacterium]|nr:glycosyl hydrolase [Acidobacteriaceae bacterium]